MIRVRSMVIAAVSFALAAISGADAWARINERNAPQTIATLPVSNGFALAERAERILQLALKPAANPGTEPVLAPTPSQRRQVMELSLKGYRREALNHTAVRNLGLLAEADGDLPGARKFMKTATSITRRDLATNIWLARDFARAGDMQGALTSFDQALRSNDRAQEVLLPALLQYLQNDELVPPIIGLLEKSPAWQDAFWSAAPRYSASLANIARVRLALARDGLEIPQQDDRNLIFELASYQHFDAGDRLVRLLSKDAKAEGEAIRNGSFDSNTVFEPFGWELFFDSSMSTDIDQSQGILRISTFAEGGGRAARQIVRLPDNTYTLSLKAEEWDRLDEAALYVRLDCAEGESPSNSMQILVNRANFTFTFRKPRRDCTYFWLTLFARPRADRQDNVVTLDGVSLRRSSGDSDS